MIYRREIDGLRALAVLPVILFHAGFQTFSGGFVGVDIFFVISGYLITSIILEEQRAGTFTLLGFYERRARRILPALFVVMVGCLVLGWLWLLPIDLKLFSESLVAVPVFASNILFYVTGNYFEPTAELKPLLHTWSLAIEEQYYVVYPMLLVLLRRLGQKWMVGLLAGLACGSLLAAQWGSHTNPVFTFFLLPTRAWELLIGALVAFYLFEKGHAEVPADHRVVNEAVSACGVVLCLYGVLVYDALTPFPSAYALLPTVGAALIIIFAAPSTMVGKLLGHKFFVALGLISYSAYLWHYPLFVFARHRSIDPPGHVLLLSLTACSFLVAYVSWKYVETPFRNRQFLARRHLFAVAAICSIAFIVLGLAGYMTGGFPQRVDEAVTKAQSPQFDPLDCMSEAGRYTPVRESCVLGARVNVTGALLGDSIAGALGFELRRSLENHSLGFSNMSYGHCPPILDVYRIDQGSTHRCPEHNREVFEYVRENDNYHTLILAGYWTEYLEGARLDVMVNGVKERTPGNTRKSALQEAYVDSLLKYIQTGKTIILIYPIPEAGWHVPRYLAKRIMFASFNQEDKDVTTSYESYAMRNKDTIQILDSVGEHPNLIRIRPDTIFCNTYVPGRCVVQLNGVSLYRDEFHLSNTGARLVVSEIMKHLGEKAPGIASAGITDR
jgi:peptidoglycan/LPS O-acetylase OafA/YrhL